MNHPLSKSKILEAEPLCLRASGAHISEIDIVKPALAGALKIYVSNNSIKTIENIPQFRSLEVLQISNNSISYIEDLKPISKLKNLKIINIEGNPVCRLPLYKIHLLALRPSLQEIDGKNVNSTNIRKKYSQNDLETIVSAELALLHSIVSCEVVDENISKIPPNTVRSVQSMIESRYPPDLLKQRYDLIRTKFSEMPTKKYLANLRSIFLSEHQNIFNKAVNESELFSETIEKHRAKLEQLSDVNNLGQLSQDADELTQIVCEYVEDQCLPSIRSPGHSSSRSAVVSYLYSPLSKGSTEKRTQTEIYDDFSDILNNNEKEKNSNSCKNSKVFSSIYEYDDETGNKSDNDHLNAKDNNEKTKKEIESNKTKKSQSKIDNCINEDFGSTSNKGERDSQSINQNKKENSKIINDDKIDLLSPTGNKSDSYSDRSSNKRKKDKKTDNSSQIQNNTNSNLCKTDDKKNIIANNSLNESEKKAKEDNEKQSLTPNLNKNGKDIELDINYIEYEEEEEFFNKNEIEVEVDININEEEEEEFDSFDRVQPNENNSFNFNENLQKSQNLDKNQHKNDFMENYDEYPDEYKIVNDFKSDNEKESAVDDYQQKDMSEGKNNNSELEYNKKEEENSIDISSPGKNVFEEKNVDEQERNTSFSSEKRIQNKNDSSLATIHNLPKKKGKDNKNIISKSEKNVSEEEENASFSSGNRNQNSSLSNIQNLQRKEEENKNTVISLPEKIIFEEEEESVYDQEKNANFNSEKRNENNNSFSIIQNPPREEKANNQSMTNLTKKVSNDKKQENKEKQSKKFIDPKFQLSPSRNEYTENQKEENKNRNNKTQSFQSISSQKSKDKNDNNIQSQNCQQNLDINQKQNNIQNEINKRNTFQSQKANADNINCENKIIKPNSPHKPNKNFEDESNSSQNRNENLNNENNRAQDLIHSDNDEFDISQHSPLQNGKISTKNNKNQSRENKHCYPQNVEEKTNKSNISQIQNSKQNTPQKKNQIHVNKDNEIKESQSNTLLNSNDEIKDKSFKSAEKYNKNESDNVKNSKFSPLQERKENGKNKSCHSEESANVSQQNRKKNLNADEDRIQNSQPNCLSHHKKYSDIEKPKNNKNLQLSPLISGIEINESESSTQNQKGNILSGYYKYFEVADVLPSKKSKYDDSHDNEKYISEIEAKGNHTQISDDMPIKDDNKEKSVAMPLYNCTSMKYCFKIWKQKYLNSLDEPCYSSLSLKKLEGQLNTMTNKIEAFGKVQHSNRNQDSPNNILIATEKRRLLRQIDIQKEINQKSVDRYNQMVKEIISKGIFLQ